jgi:Oxidoreductase family, NAD-binding Rossmann fold
MVDLSRRNLLGGVVAASTALAVGRLPAATGTERGSFGRGASPIAVPKLDSVRFGVIGVGMRGHELLRLTLAVEGAQVNALCDVDASALGKAAELVLEKTGRSAGVYGGRDDAYKALVTRNDIDAVIIATPWQWHVPMALDALAAGKHVFVEVPAALNIEDAWRLIEASEKHRLNCMMLENCCYGRSELMLLNMARDGLLGEIVHGEGAYIHDLRWLLDDAQHGEGSWRPEWYTQRRANAYPTHGLGPIARCMDIHRGDRLDFLVSVGSPARGFAAYGKRKFAPQDARNKMKFVLSDMNSSVIQTARGRTILLQHDVCTPRPYSRTNLLQGVNGVFAGYPDRLSLDDHGSGEDWITDLSLWIERYDSRLWKELEKNLQAQGGGHGGMDYVMLWRIVECLRAGQPLDMDVYDAAAWSVIFELSERSVRNRSRPQDFPDFTRGRWENAAPSRAAA